MHSLYNRKVNGILEIGKDSVKGMLIKGKNIEKIYVERLKQGHVVKEEETIPRNLIESVLVELDLLGKNIILILGLDNFLIKSINMNYNMDTSNDEKGVIIKNYLNSILENYNIDLYETRHYVVEAGESNQNEEVMTISLEKSIIKIYLDFFRELHITILNIKPSFFSFTKFLKDEREYSDIVVDITKETTMMYVLENGLVKLYRVIPMGSTTFINNLKNITVENVELIISEVDLDKNYEDEKRQKIQSNMQEVANNFVEQINIFKNFYNNKTNKDKIGEIILIGEGSIVLGLDVFLETYLEQKVIHLNKDINIAKSALNLNKDLDYSFAELATLFDAFYVEVRGE